MTRVVIVDDHPTFLRGLRAVLERLDDVEVVGEARTGEQALEVCAAVSPDVVVMDLLMPGMGGLEATRRLLRETTDVHVLVLTMNHADESVYAALRAGARGYLLKDAAPDEIAAAVRTVATGSAVYGPAVAARIATFFAAAPTTRPFPELTDREREVLDLLAAGMDNATIARRLHLSVKTIRNVVSVVLGKLQAADRTEAALRARDMGMGTGDSPLPGRFPGES